jgi:NADH-quinone oxidoreductase subunit M
VHLFGEQDTLMATLLVITVFLPLLGSLVLFLSPRMEQKDARNLALGTALLTLAFTLVLLVAFRPGVTTPQFAYGPAAGPYGLPWMERPDIRFALGLDGISVLLFGLTSLLLITAIFSSWESITDRAPMHYAFLLALECGLLGLFSSLDVVLFYIFFEFSLVPLFFLIGIWGGPERRRASITFFLYTLAGSLLTLLGVIALVVIHYQYAASPKLTFSIPELTAGLSTLVWPEWTREAPWSASPQVLVFLLLFAGFAIKVPMFPFHTWLPLAHVEAPTAGSILLAGVLLKVGSYGLLRFNMAMTPVGAKVLFPLLAGLAVVGIIYGALTALAQSDIKRLIAYSSVSHMGFVVLGLFAMNRTGMDGSSMQMINHGLTTGALFACVGVIYERYHTREMAEMSGLWARLPLFAFFFILTALGSAALPGLNGFVGEFPTLVGMFGRSFLPAVLATIGMILGAYYLLWMIQRVVFGPLREPHVHGHEHGQAGAAEHEGAGAVRPLGWHEIGGLAPLAVFIVLIGVLPGIFFARIRPSVALVVAPYEKMDRDAAAVGAAGARVEAGARGPHLLRERGAPTEARRSLDDATLAIMSRFEGHKAP